MTEVCLGAAEAGEAEEVDVLRVWRSVVAVGVGEVEEGVVLQC